jgi:hypothetical protein
MIISHIFKGTQFQGKFHLLRQDVNEATAGVRPVDAIVIRTWKPKNK